MKPQRFADAASERSPSKGAYVETGGICPCGEFQPDVMSPRDWREARHQRVAMRDEPPVELRPLLVCRRFPVSAHRGGTGLGDRCRIPRAFWSALEHLGLSPVTVLNAAHLPGVLHLEEIMVVSTAQLLSIWSAIEELAADAAFGYELVRSFGKIGQKPISITAGFAADFRVGIEAVIGFRALCTPEIFHLDDTEEGLRISRQWRFATEAEPAIATDVAFASLVQLGRDNTGVELAPVRIELTRTDSRTGAPEAFFRCPILYGAPRNLMFLSTDDLRRTFPKHNPEFFDIVIQALSAVLEQVVPRGSFIERLKNLIKSNLMNGHPDLARSAQSMGTSARTLQRRISDEGSTFNLILAEVRQELARDLLLNTNLTLSAIAHALGYQNVSSFNRRFAEREGLTPGRWRSAHRTTTQQAAPFQKQIEKRFLRGVKI